MNAEALGEAFSMCLLEGKDTFREARGLTLKKTLITNAHKARNHPAGAARTPAK